jgi:cellulose 1,4-beta-cellobiosidase
MRRRHLPVRIMATALLVAGAMLIAPAAAFGLFSAAPSAPSAAVTAAAIAAPTGFTATATGTATANLSWVAPATLTGFTLSQSPGTLAGCSATPTSSTTSCAATGLSPATTYTWTLTAVYNSWASAYVQANAETNFSATDLGNGTASCIVLSLLCNGPSVTTAGSGGELIFIYLKGAGTALGTTTVAGVTGPFTAAAQVASVQYPAASGNFLYVWKATGNGTGPTQVQITFNVSPCCRRPG